MFVNRVSELALHHSQLERGAKEVVFNSAIGPELDHFASIVFEQVCQQYFWRMGLEGKLPFAPRQIGGWWQANREVDLVLLGETQALLAECKWSSRPVGIDISKFLQKTFFFFAQLRLRQQVGAQLPRAPQCAFAVKPPRR